MVDALLRRLLTDEVLKRAQDAVSGAEQSDREIESKFVERVSKAARLCCHVSSKGELVNYYVQGLRPAIREILAQQVRWMPKGEISSFSAVR